MATQTTPAQQNPTVLIKEITDQYVRKNFTNIANYFSNQNQLLNFKFFEISVGAKTDSATIAHGLGVAPKDIVILFVSGAGQITFDLDGSDATNLSYSTTDQVYCRIMVGSYWGNQSSNASPGKMTVPPVLPSVSGSPSTAFNIKSKLSSYSAVVNDYIIVSGASFSLTLPTAVGVAGQQIGIQHNGISLSQIYTLNTTSGQAIGGIASGAYVLYTNSETLLLISDGVNWQILSHKTETGWNGAPNIVSAVTTPPVKGTTATDVLWWRRHGNVMEMRLEYRQTATGLGNAGSGDYLFQIPANAAIDTNFLAVFGGASIGFAAPMSVNTVGSFNAWNSTSGIVGGVFVYDSKSVRMGGPALAVSPNTVGPQTISSGSLANFSSPGLTISASLVVPILGWQP